MTWTEWLTAHKVSIRRVRSRRWGTRLSIDGLDIRLTDPAGTGATAWPNPALLRVGRHLWQITPDRARRLTIKGT